MEKENFVPDIIDKAPEEVAQISYPSGVKVDLGNELTPTKVKDEPILTWNANKNMFYTVAMVDVDVPSRLDPKSREVLHWIIGNVPGIKIENGDTIAEYIGSGPPKGTGLHRTIEGRMGFSIKKFAEKYNLGQPIAGNFYQAQFDDYVPILHKQFNK